MRHLAALLSAAALSFVFVACVLAEEPAPGHSGMLEAFNEGPRQAAYLMGGTGAIHFTITSRKPDVQAYVEQGIGQVHGFWYFEAERSFRHAAMLDHHSAIAYWGMAMANEMNGGRAKTFLAEAKKLRSYATEREAMYIDALDDWLSGAGNQKEKTKRLADAYAAIAARYPDDLEAKAFYALTLYKFRTDLDKQREDVQAAIDVVLAVEPLHPVHHYSIHLWDSGGDASKGLASSARCGQGSPGIAHMWHMPGHIYAKLNRFEDAVWQQEASARVDHAHMRRDRVLPDEIHNFAHNNEWLIRDLIYVGRWRDAARLSRSMLEIPRHPKYNVLAQRRSTYFGRVRLLDTLARFEQWPAIVEACEGTLIEPTDEEAEQVRRLRNLGVALAELGQVDRAQVVRGQLQADVDRIDARAAIEQADRKEGPPAKPDKDVEESRKRFAQGVAAIDGHLAFAAGNFAAAVANFKTADEDKYLLARAQFFAGQKDDALKEITEYVKSRENQVHPLAVQVELLSLAEKKDEAREAFEKLRKLSGSVQLDAPVFDRLEPIARDFGFCEDWRIVNAPASDVGTRPNLDDLGPFCWTPSPAPSWNLIDAAGKPHAMADYHGRPVVAIFFLGSGCLHCAEQLQKFAPLAEKFHAAGIDLVAISTDDQAGLQTSIENYSGEFPFPLLSDAEMTAFRSYRAYDDFERKPLHGTFLIDAAGQLRWQDISAEPFMDAEFVLKEAQRLLAIPSNHS